jgi:hypothetical protein
MGYGEYGRRIRLVKRREAGGCTYIEVVIVHVGLRVLLECARACVGCREPPREQAEHGAGKRAKGVACARGVHPRSFADPKTGHIYDQFEGCH